MMTKRDIRIWLRVAGRRSGCSQQPASPTAAEQITFVSQGGAYQQAQTMAILDPSAKKLGITINQDSHSRRLARDQDAGRQRQADLGRRRYADRLLPARRRAGADREARLLEDPERARRCRRPIATPIRSSYEFYSSVLAYSQKKFPKDAPNSWADFWDVKKFPGRRALRNHPIATLEAALMADGVAPDKLYPLDVDRAFKKLEEIKPNITVWWTSGAQSAQLLNDGEVDMEMAWNGRVSAVAKEGAKVAFTYNQGILQSTSLCILKGAPNLDDGGQIPQRGRRSRAPGQSAAHIDYGPGNPKAFDTGVIKPERAAQLPSEPENAAKQALMSYAWWSSPAGEAAEKRWVSFMQK